MAKEDFTIKGETIETNILTQEGHFDPTTFVTITIDEMLDLIGEKRINEYIQKKKQN